MSAIEHTSGSDRSVEIAGAPSVNVFPTRWLLRGGMPPDDENRRSGWILAQIEIDRCEGRFPSSGPPSVSRLRAQLIRKRYGA